MTLRTVRQYATLPQLPARGPMPPIVGVIIPIARTNLITNPSLETATTGYTAVGGSIARSATQQYHGTYSLAVTPGAGTTDGAYFGSVTLTASQAYAFSCKFLGVLGIPYKISIATTGGSDLAVYTFTGTGRWQWVYGYHLEPSGASRRFYFTKNGSTNTGVFYVDGVQIEAINAGETVSTYIDGDQLGLLIGQQPPAYTWTGTPHASTSMRSALTRAGGYVANLAAYNFLLTGLIGLGLAVPNNVSIPYTVLDGARYQRTTKPPRSLTLAGRWQSDDVREQFMLSSDMRGAFDRDLVPLQQPMVLTVEPQDDCGQVIGDFAQIQCIYAGGLEGNDGNLPVEDVAPTFTMYVPYITGGDAGVSLTVQTSIVGANNILVRSPLGVWSAVGTSPTGPINAIAIGPDGAVYVGGNFTNVAGIANADYIAKWDGSAWSALSTGMDDEVNDLAFDAAGNLYATGKFLNAGGGAAVRIARWNGSAWSALSTGLTGGAGAQGNAVVVDRTGNIYVGGNFTDAGGSGADFIAMWNGSAFSALSSVTAVNNIVRAVAVSANNTIYVGGSFTDAGGVTNADRIAAWSGTAWSALSTGMDAQVETIAVLPNNIIMAGGSFTTAGGVSAPNIAQWNGTGWATVGTLNNTVGKLIVGERGNVYASGDFTTANGITLPDRSARWNGSTWLPLDIDLPGSAANTAAVTARDGTMYMAFKASGTATAAAITSVTNDAPGYVWPKLVINGPSASTSRIYQIVNYTTGFGVWLNLTLSPGEVATLNFDPQAPSFTTTFQGDITNKILPGSQPALMYLAPGSNSISFYAAQSTVTATLSWQKRYNGLADLVN